MNSFDMPTMVAELRRDEGVRLKPYRDTVGKLTVGTGRNLDDVGISDDENNLMISNDIGRTCAGLDKAIPWWRNLDPVRQRVIVNMAFNLGVYALLGFHDTLSAIQASDWQGAHDGMLASHWANQVGERAQRLASMILTGEAS